MRPLFTLLWLVLPFCLSAKQPVNTQSQKSSLVFIENKGQIIDQYSQLRNDIDFKLNAPAINIFIGDAQIHYQWARLLANEKHNLPLALGEIPEIKIETYRLDVILLNANKNAEVVKEEQQEFYENYYLPQCPNGLTAHSYKKIIYKNIYPNIDWVLYITSP